jgi:Mg-chelatase subunit ChlD
MDSSQLDQRTSRYRTPHMVYLLIDCSTSMDGAPLFQAKQGALNFADEARAKAYRVGLVRFSDDAYALKNPDTGFTDAVDSLTAYGTTNLTAGIELATEHLMNEATGQRVMCVVTDGLPDHTRSALKAARRAGDLGIHIMAIGTAGANEKFLNKLVTSQALSSYVETAQLQSGVTDMARLLPPPR